MKIQKTVLRLLFVTISLLLGYVLINTVGYAFGLKNISVMSALDSADDYRIRSELLQEAMANLGMCSARDAAVVWANGLKYRSAAMQYSVMSENLKTEYARQLDKNSPNWVTGLSSPWVESYTVTQQNSGADEIKIFELTFLTMTSTGPAGRFKAILTISPEGDFWRITKIKTDPELYAYTMFTPVTD